MTFTEKGLKLVKSLRYQRATNVDQLEAIFRLRYKCYLQEGIIDLDKHKRFSDHFDDLPNTINIGVFRDGSLYSAIRLHIIRTFEDNSPTRSVFADIIDPILKSGCTIVDPSRFVVSSQGERQSPLAALVTLRAATAAALHFNAQIVLAPVRTEHCSFYRRYLGCSLIAEPRSYPGINTKLCLMAVEHHKVRNEIAVSYPFLVTDAVEHTAMFLR